MALTADQLAYWEASPQDFPLFMYIHSPTTVFAARVNQTSFPNPLMTVTFDTVTTGHYSVIEEGMTILFGSTAGGDDLGRLPVRRDTSGLVSTSTLLYVQRASQGVGDGEVSLVDNAYITILNQYLVWSVPPYITDAGVVYKNGNVPYVANIAQRPQANTGGDVLKIVNEGVTSATVSFDGSTSAVYNPAASSTLTYAWNFADGTPSTSTSATPGNVSFPLGKRHIRLSVTDSAGSVRTAHALVVVAQRDDPDLIHYWDVESWTERVDGQDIRIRVHQPLSYATYPDGTDVLICTSEDVDQVGLAGRSHMLFSGWLHDEVNRVEASKQGLVSRLTFQLLDVAGRLKILHQFPESVDRESGASSWAQMVGLNLDRLAHYSLDWHSTALSRVDYIGANQMDVYAIRGLEIGGDNLFSGVNFIASAMGYLFTCDINNRLILRQDPQLAPTAAQNSVLGIGFARSTAETLTLQPKHWQNYEYSFKRMPRVHFNWGETLLSSPVNMSSTSEIPTAFVAAPGLAPGQGTSESNTTRQVSRNVAEIRMRVGNLYRARQNALTENFQFELNPMRHAIHPANVEWFEASIASAQSGYRGRLFTAERFLPIEMNYRTDVSKRIRRATVAVEREVTNATPATQYTPASTSGSNWSVNLPDISLGEWVYEPIPMPGFGGLVDGVQTIASPNVDNYMYITTNYEQLSPTWIRYDLVALGMAGTLVDFIVAADSPLYMGTGSTVNGLLVSSTHAYFMLDIFGTPSLTNSYALRYTTLFRNRNAQGSRSQPGFYAIVSHQDDAKVDVDVTDDHGATWTRYTDLGGSWVGGAGDDASGGIYVSEHVPNRVYVGAFTGSGATGLSRVYRTDNAGVSFATQDAVTNTQLPSLVHIPFANTSENRIYVGRAGNNAITTGIQRLDSGVATNISPVVSGNYYGTLHNFGFKTYDLNQLRGLLVGYNADTVFKGVWLTDDGGSTWTNLIAPSGAVAYEGGNIAGDNPNIFFLFGNGAQGFSGDGGVSFQDKLGNIPVDYPSASVFVNLLGG